MKTLFGDDNSKTVAEAAIAARFNRFWAVYPRRVAIGNAKKVWAKIKPDDNLTQKMITAIGKQAMAHGWYRDKKFCPHPATWLNAERWNDEVEKPASDLSQQYAVLTTEDMKRKRDEVF
ncbi:MAG: hypothetical protein ABIG61_07390 [Planctomycetota bacterium]